MSFTTVPKLAKALGLSERLIREEVEAGILPAYQNRAAEKKNKKHSVYYIPFEVIPEWLRGFPHCSDEKIEEVLKKLGVNFKQLLLFEVA